MKSIFNKFTSNSLARNGVIVFVGSMVANVASYVYHLLMGRFLGPSGYGELSSLLSLLYIFSVPLIVGQTVLVKFVSGFKAHGEIGQAKSLLVSVTRLFIIICLVGFPVVILITPVIRTFLHLSSPFLFIVAYILFIFSLLNTTAGSMLQGYQKFVWFSVFSAGVIVIKVFFSIPFVRWGVLGVLIAAAAASIVNYLLYYFPLRFVLNAKSRPTKLTKRAAFGFAIPTLLTLLGITSIYSTDIILVRHFFSAGSAGLYAALAILGKIIFFASSAVTSVIFPVLSEQTAKGNVSKKLIGSAIAAVTVISFGITAVYFLFPDFIVHMLFGNAYAGAGSLLGLFGVFLAFFTIGNVISNICLARGYTGIWIFPVVCALLQIIGITVFHLSVLNVIIMDICVSVIFVAGALGYYLKKSYEKV